MIFNLLINKHVDFAKTAILLFSDSHLAGYSLRNFAIRLLARGMDIYGDTMDIHRLYDWLGIGLDKYGHRHLESEETIQHIRAWLEERPQIQNAIYSMAIERCKGEENADYCMRKVHDRLFHAEPPADFGEWCLSQLHDADNDHVAKFLLNEVIYQVRREQGHGNLTLESIEREACRNPRYESLLSDLLVCEIDLEDQRYRRRQQLYKSDRQR